MPSWFGDWSNGWFDDWLGESLAPADKTIDTPLQRTRFVPAVTYPTIPAVARERTVAAVVREVTLSEDPPS